MNHINFKFYEAGAAIVHIHARNPEKGFPTHDLEIIKAVIDSIHDKAPEILINLSTAISAQSSPEQRIAPVQTYKPPLASLNTNSMNFSIGDFKTGEVVMGDDYIFANTFKNIQIFAKEMKKARTKPEMEVYDYGGLYNMLHINKQEDLFEHPLHFQLVWGVLGGVPFSIHNLAHLLNIMPSGSTWSVCGVAKDQFRAAMCATPMGGHIRVGLEDNIRNIDGSLSKGSWEQVEWAVKVARIVGREPATPDEARKCFNLLQ